MQTPTIDPTSGRRGRTLVVVVAAVLLTTLGVTAVRAALGGARMADRAGGAPSVPITSRATEPSADPTPKPSPRQNPSPSVDPNALANGIYPTYVRTVDVAGAMITVDVLQVFTGSDAHRAAIEDGMSWEEIRYNPAYIRNENPLLRTLPVARDAHIRFLGTCDAPSRYVGLVQLRKETRWASEGIYYDVTMLDGRVVGIEQKIAISGC
jgi:hypothetical protein